MPDVTAGHGTQDRTQDKSTFGPNLRELSERIWNRAGDHRLDTDTFVSGLNALMLRAVKNGEDLNVRNPDGFTLMHIAIMASRASRSAGFDATDTLKIVEALNANGVGFAPYNKNQTPIRLVLTMMPLREAGCTEMVVFMLEKGAPVSQRDVIELRDTLLVERGSTDKQILDAIIRDAVFDEELNVYVIGEWGRDAFIEYLKWLKCHQGPITGIRRS